MNKTSRIHKHFLLFGALVIVGMAAAMSAQASSTFYYKLDDDPTTLNPVTFTDIYSGYVLGYVYDSLLQRDEDNWDWIPALAEKWNVSKDGMKFTFILRKGLKFHDGISVTAEDVKYSFDVFFEGRFVAPEKKVLLEGIKEAKVIDPRTVQFTAKEP